ncbi:MAG: DUF58 domain-containing protein [Muribaculaceae bacterium]|nr:DUF58 domain-containing protein [Muribaculaceae bacterium]
MFLPIRFYYTAMVVIVVLSLGQLWPPLFYVGALLLALFALLLVIDIALLWTRRGITARRHCSSRFSNGDENPVSIQVENNYRFGVKLSIIDEIPHIFQRRDVNFSMRLKAGENGTVDYTLRPTRRGVYGFGHIRAFASSPIGLLQRRFTCDEPTDVAVYPSYLMLNQYAFLAISNNLTEMGIKRIRRVGNNTEFEQIKSYVQGDDYRLINWKASARAHQLMVNVYTDERSQQIINVIDKGRIMQQAFEGMTILDYAINAALVLSYVALHRDDKAGVITFADEFNDFVKPDRGPAQMNDILECLYHQTTDFAESDYSTLVVNTNHLVGQRSLLILYTNFFDYNSMLRQLPYLRQLNSRHRLVVVFFIDNERRDFINQQPHSIRDYYEHSIAAKIDHEQTLIINTLRQYGINSLLTSPQNLSVNVINRYLEMKSRGQF